MKEVIINDITLRIGDVITWEHNNLDIIRNFTILSMNKSKMLLQYNYLSKIPIDTRAEKYSEWFAFKLFNNDDTFKKVYSRTEKLERLLR